MSEELEIKGRVKHLKQRADKRNLGLDRLPDFETYDVEFSLSGQILKKAWYTYGRKSIGFEAFHYRDDGQLARTECFTSAGTLEAVRYVKYDENGIETGCKYCLPNGELAGRGEIRYEGDRKIQEESFSKDGLPIKKMFFTWNGDGLSKVDAEFYGYDGKLTERWKENYDKTGRLIETFGLKPDGEPLGDGRYVFEYDKQGRKSRIWTFNGWVEDHEPSSVQVFEYDSDDLGNWIETRKFHRSRSDERWSKHRIRRAITYYK